MTTPHAIDSNARDTRNPLPAATTADDRLIPALDMQATWVAVAVAQSDPERWLFGQRSRFLRDGRCDPWAQQLLQRAGLLPLAG